MLKPTANSGERLYITVARRLEQAIEAGTYPIGSRLPAERELSDRLGVSRPVIREALIVLEIRGYISVRPNGGTVVATREARSGAVPAMQADAGPFEVTEARRLLEGEVAALAATLITDDQFEELEETLRLMDDPMLDGQARERADRAFHMALARITGNDVLVSMVESLWDMRYNSALCIYFFQQAREHGIEPPADQHRLIIDALRARNPEAARAAMREHLTKVTESLLIATEEDARERERLKVTERGSDFARRARIGR
ncbi:GntR family transcriptional repressor for pyruvate dehydrogenase complex [Sphingomonas zeicaulis]|uniref:FadR/GntR family transcriptional regulator n=1 Tax=Sphingomonas zeicaulis TaxID=1632740 RepID=UPI003D2486FD